MSAAKTCYRRDGIPDPDSRPCDPTSDVKGQCCSPHSVCLTNGLCYQQEKYGTRVATGTCTDVNWGPSCVKFCDFKPEISHAINYAQPGGEYGGKFCCGTYDPSTKQCWETHNGTKDPFTLRTGYVYFPNTSTILETYAEEALKNKSSLAANLTDPNANGNCSTNSSDTNLAKRTVGVATGATLGVALLVVVALLIWKCREVKALRRELVGVHIQKADPKTEFWQNDGIAHNTDRATLLLPAEHNQRSHLDGHHEYELSVDHTVSEMPHRVIRQELAGHQ